MDIEYFMKVQNAFGTKNKREKNLSKVNRYADRHFEDTFDTQDVLVNNVSMQIIIVKDTDGNVNKKKIKTKHSDKINVGDYVLWKNQVWMISLLDPDDKVWNSGYMYLCTLLLRWQDEHGTIIERWGYSEDYTKYSMGEKGNNIVTVGDYQYGLTLPVDNDTKKLKRGKRFVVDFDGNYPPDVYELTGKKSFLNDYTYFDRGGLITFTLSYNFFSSEKDKLVKLDNGKEVWICDYHSPTIEGNESQSENISASIIGNDKLKIGFDRTYSATFTDKSENVIYPNFTWNIVSDFEVKQELIENKIKLLVNDEDYISSSFLLQVIIDNKVLSEKTISVIEGF